MFSRVKSKTAVITGVILTMVTLSAGQGFNLEWEIDNLTTLPLLPSYIPTDQNQSGAILGEIYFPHNIGNEFNIENDGIPEIIIPETKSDSVRFLKDIQIYNGVTYALRYTVNFTNFPEPMPSAINFAFFDIDNDGTKEMLLIPYYPKSIFFVNVQTSSIKYEVDSVNLCGVYDLNHDGNPEFWCVKGGYPNGYILQIWGSGPTMAKSSPPALMKQNLARLIGNSPNPFVSSTKIEYYVPEKQNVQLQIFSSDGKLLRNLVNGPQKMGEYSALWDGKTDNGQMMAVGSYYYRLKVGDFVSSKKMVELK